MTFRRNTKSTEVLLLAQRPNWRPSHEREITVHIPPRLFFPRCNRASQKKRTHYSREWEGPECRSEVTERRNSVSRVGEAGSKEAAAESESSDGEGSRRESEIETSMLVRWRRCPFSGVHRPREIIRELDSRLQQVGHSASAIPGRGGGRGCRCESRVRTRAAHSGGSL